MSPSTLQRLYVVYDSVASCVTGPIMAFPNDAAARRTFQDAVTNSQSSLSSHPSDYSLHYIGDVDMADGTIRPLEFGVINAESQVVTGDMIVEILRARQESDNE